MCTHTKCIYCAEQYIVNFSGATLTDAQKLALSKGLTFIPTAKSHTSMELLNDFNAFSSKLCNKVLGVDHSSKDGFDLYHKNKQKKNIFRPTNYQNFEGILGEMKQKISEIPMDNIYITQNLSRDEKNALKELIDNTNLVINKADKGSTIVVQDRNR